MSLGLNYLSSLKMYLIGLEYDKLEKIPYISFYTNIIAPDYYFKYHIFNDNKKNRYIDNSGDFLNINLGYKYQFLYSNSFDFYIKPTIGGYMIKNEDIGFIGAISLGFSYEKNTFVELGYSFIHNFPTKEITFNPLGDAKKDMNENNKNGLILSVSYRF